MPAAETIPAPATLTTEGITALLADARKTLASARSELARAKALQLVSAAEKALQFANRRDRQAAGTDISDVTSKIADKVAHYGRILGTDETAWRNPAFVCM